MLRRVAAIVGGSDDAGSVDAALRERVCQHVPGVHPLLGSKGPLCKAIADRQEVDLQRGLCRSAALHCRQRLEDTESVPCEVERRVEAAREHPRQKFFWRRLRAHTHLVKSQLR